MSDPAGFAMLVDAKSGMLSTYDRTGGNADWAGWQPALSAGNCYSVADLKGPGCLTRIWTTGFPGDEWRIYVDDDVEPRIRGREWDLFGARGPALPPLADRLSGAAHTYMPVPYSKRLRVEVYAPKLAKEHRPYYQVGYHTYPDRTRVSSRTGDLSEGEKVALNGLMGSWESCEAQARAEEAAASWKAVTVAPGAREALWVEDRKGGGTIKALVVRIKGLSGMSVLDRPRVLRNLVLECRWDGAPAPSVEVPLGDFFCNGLAFRSFASLPLANVDGVFLSRFPMPFKKTAKIEVRNDGSMPVTIEASARCEAATGAAAAAPSYLHASWNSGKSLGGSFRVMRTEGNGQFVGCYLISYGMDGSWSILEGDESFLVDGETSPSWHGTGLEDYFNGGWYYYGLFERALYGLLEKAAMRTAQYRFHLSDPVRFRKSLQMQFEFGDANRARGYMSATGYWYQDTPSPANSSIPAVAQRFPEVERVGLTAVMSDLFEHEKVGLIPDAVERCRYYEALFSGNAYGPMYGLRGLAYTEALEGNLNVRARYAALASRTDVPAEVAAQARLLHWLGDGTDRALLGAHAAGTWRLFWDGRLAGEGDGPFEFKAFPLELTPGEHWIGAEVTPRTQGAFVSVCLRSAFTNVTTDLQWEYIQQKPEGWPKTGGAGWLKGVSVPSMFPQMAWWQFVPNAFVGMQQGWQVIYPYAGWDQPPGRTVYMRRLVVIPSIPANREVMFPRRKQVESQPVRPAGDTSNDK